MRFKEFELKNKSKLVVIELESSNSVTISAYFKAGFRYDPPNRPGLAHFTEHMLFSGTKKYQDSERLEGEIAKLGGWHSAFTWIDYQYQTLHLPAGLIRNGVEILSEIILNSKLASSEVERERGVVVAEIARNKSDPEKAIWDYVWQPLFWQGTKLARPYSGSYKDILKISSLDVKRFFHDYFVPSRTTFFVAGGVGFSEAVEEFDKKFGNWRSKVNSTEDVLLNPSRSKTIFTYPQKFYQNAIAIGFKTVPSDYFDSCVLELLRYYLGGSYASRLPQRLRKAGGLIYTWQMWYDELKDNGYLLFTTGSSDEYIPLITTIFFREIKRLKEKKLDSYEVDDAISGLCNNLLANTQTGEDFIRYYARQLFSRTGRMWNLNDLIKIYRKITPDDILRVAKMYFRDDNWYVGCVGEINSSEIKISTI